MSALGKIVTEFAAPTLSRTGEVSLPAASEWAQHTLGFQPDTLQAAILDDPSDRILLLCTRQWGKSTVAAIKALHFALTHPHAAILIASASLRQSGALLAKIRRFAPDFSTVSEGIQLPNGSRILALPQSPERIRCFTADLVVVDEAAFVSDEFFDAITPALAATNGAIWLLSSANARDGFFYHTAVNALSGWSVYTATAEMCPRISSQFLERERRTKDTSTFNREYMCQFSQADDQYYDDELIASAFTEDFATLRSEPNGNN